MVLQRSRLALTQTVNVQDGHQVVQLIVGGEGHGLPHRALRQLSITQQAEHPVAAHRGCLAELTWQINRLITSFSPKPDSQIQTHKRISDPTRPRHFQRLLMFCNFFWQLSSQINTSQLANRLRHTFQPWAQRKDKKTNVWHRQTRKEEKVMKGIPQRRKLKKRRTGEKTH